MSANVLASKDVNASMAAQEPAEKSIKSMEYHRQVLQSKMEAAQYVSLRLTAIKTSGFLELTIALRRNKQYVSPSDNIMSPCTAKLNAFRTKQVGK